MYVYYKYYIDFVLLLSTHLLLSYKLKSLMDKTLIYIVRMITHLALVNGSVHFYFQTRLIKHVTCLLAMSRIY